MKIYFYPFQMQQKIIRATCHGNEKILKEMFNRVLTHKDNVNLEPQMKKALFFDLTGTFMKCLKNIDDTEKIAQDYLNYLESVQKVEITQQEWDNLFDYFLQACKIKLDFHLKQNNMLIDDALKYIDDHFDNPNFNLSMLADSLGISEKTVSNLFIQSINTKFSVYLEKMRMDKAVQLLSQTEQSITEIALTVGYTNVHSFRRAYKRVFNDSPKSMRS